MICYSQVHFLDSPENDQKAGNFFEIRQRPPLPTVSVRAASTRGTHIVAGFARSLRFPTLRRAASATGGARLRSHRAARSWKPNQVRCMHPPGDGPGESAPRGQRNKPSHSAELISLESGNVLLSRPVSRQVPSALKGLTSVFGMGTGGSLSPLSPEFCQGLVQSVVLLASAVSISNHSLRLGNPPHIRASFFYCAYP